MQTYLQSEEERPEDRQRGNQANRQSQINRDRQTDSQIGRYIMGGDLGGPKSGETAHVSVPPIFGEEVL